MDVMNDLYKEQCLVLPNEYVFLTGELRETNHTRGARAAGMHCNETAQHCQWVHSWVNRARRRITARYLQGHLRPVHSKAQKGVLFDILSWRQHGPVMCHP